MPGASIGRRAAHHADPRPLGVHPADRASVLRAPSDKICNPANHCQLVGDNQRMGVDNVVCGAYINNHTTSNQESLAML
jgi:hypothetical protein